MCYAIVRLTVFTLLHEASAYIDSTKGSELAVVSILLWRVTLTLIPATGGG